MNVEQKFEKFRAIPTPVLLTLLDANRMTGGARGIHDPQGMDDLENVAIIADVLRERGVNPDVR
jgi:hypothetical protein